MIVIMILSIASAGMALALVGRAALLPRMQARESLGRIDSYGLPRTSAGEGLEAEDGLLRRAALRLGTVMSRDGDERLETLRTLLLSAGVHRVSPSTFLGYRALTGIVTGALALWLGSLSGLSLLLVIPLSAYAGFLGWMALLFALKVRASNRLERIEIEMPELIDLLVVTLEAGLGFSSALQRSAERIKGPLGDELRLVLQEYGLGLTIEDALRNMLKRCDAPAVRSFVRAITQGQSLGISVGQLMRNLAGDLRMRRRQLVEERAHKAPIKILFPLAFLILPATFIVVLYPGLANVLQVLNST